METISTTELKNDLLRRLSFIGQDLLVVTEQIEEHWSPPEVGELADAVVSLKSDLMKALRLTRERMRLEAKSSAA